MSHRAAIVFATAVALLSVSVATGHASTFIEMHSEPGDYIGGGGDYEYTTEDGTISVTASGNRVSVSFNGGDRWNFDFAGPSGTTLVPGAYEEATRYPFQSPTGNGLSVSGKGRGCNKLTGRFDVLEAAFGGNGEIEQLAVDFEQHCEGQTPALFGKVRYNTTVGVPPRVAITANGSHAPIVVEPGEEISLEVQIEAGDDLGVPSERWLGLLRSGLDKWYMVRGQREGWKLGLPPRLWAAEPLADLSQSFVVRLNKPGVYLFQVVVDEEQDGRLDTQFVDYVVVTVLPQSTP